MIDVVVADEDGNVVRQLDDDLVRAFSLVLEESLGDATSCCLRFVDPHGDTTFNRLQAEAIQLELAAIAEHDWSLRAQAGIDAVRDLAGEVIVGTHIYLKFLGD